MNKLVRLESIKRELKQKKNLSDHIYQLAVINLQRVVWDPNVSWYRNMTPDMETRATLRNSFSWNTSPQRYSYWSFLDNIK